MKKTLIITLTLVEALFIFLAYNSYKNNNVVLDDVKLKEDVKIEKKAFALMIQQNDGTYTESQSNTFPTDMVFNKTKSGCIDEKGNPIDNSLDYEDGKVVVTTNKTAYCYVYFDLNNAVSAYIPRLFTSTNDTSKISKYTGPVTDECSASSCTTVQQAQNVYIVTSNDINNVIFEGYCWKIIRTTETKGMKLLYNGIPITVDNHQECVANNGVNAQLTAAQMGTANNTITYSQGYVSNSPAYVGYMYNKTSGTLREMLYADDVNTNDSLLKEKIEYWFQNNSNIDESKLEDAVYCNDRSLASNSPATTEELDETYDRGTIGNVYFKNCSQQSTLECTNQTDSFNTVNTKAKTNAKVGFMTEVERYLMTSTDTNRSTAASGQNYWLGSPIDFVGDAGVLRVGTDGSRGGYRVYLAYGVRPVVSTNTGVQITSGNGSTTSPFIAS